jgi:hypothetical protein
MIDGVVLEEEVEMFFDDAPPTDRDSHLGLFRREHKYLRLFKTG